MKRMIAISVLMVLAALNASAVQQGESARTATREKLRRVLATSGPRINVDFQQSEKQPFNFAGVMRKGLMHCDSLEIVVGVSSNDTIAFRIYPHYKGGYINSDKVRNGPGLMRLLLSFSDKNFLYWGIDSSGDVFAGYTFTLESGFPPEAIDVVVRSITNLDKSVGEMRPFIDGTTGD